MGFLLPATNVLVINLNALVLYRETNENEKYLF